MTDKEVIATWCANNPYVFYGDYRDQLSQKQIGFIIHGKFDDFWYDWFETEMEFDVDWDAHRVDLCEHLGVEELSDEQEEIFSEQRITDSSDLLRTCCRNSTPHVVTIPYLDAERDTPFEFPHHELDDEENERRNAVLKEILGIEDGWKAETIYSFDILKVCGTIDLWDMIQNRPKIKGIKIGPTMKASLVTHNSHTGSGGMGDIKVTKSGTFPCYLIYDETNRYGVQAVFGFTETFWSGELEFEYEETKDQVEGNLPAQGS